MDLDKLRTRIKALRAKTVANGCTEAEALAAATKVAELVEAYGVSEADLPATRCQRLEFRPAGKQRRPPIDYCVDAIARFTGCKAWRETGPDRRPLVVFFGLPPDLEAARALADIVEAAMRAEAERWKRERKVISYKDDEMRAFLTGMAIAIGEQLLAIRDDRERAKSGGGRALVVARHDAVEREFAGLGLALREGGPSGVRLGAAAFDSGLAAGERFEVD